MASRKRLSTADAVSFCTQSDDDDSSSASDSENKTSRDEIHVEEFGEPDEPLSDNEYDQLTSDEEAEHDEEGGYAVQTVRFIRRKKFIFHDIESSLNSDNYDPLVFDCAEENDSLEGGVDCDEEKYQLKVTVDCAEEIIDR